MCLPITPTFVLPYKRYASFSLLPLVQEYLDVDRTSYESCVRNKGVVRGYVTRDGQTVIDERALNRSTLWRWVGYLGAQLVALQCGLDLWQQHDPVSSLHRFVGAVAPRKYHSPERGQRLRTARRLLHLIDRWDRAFAQKFFPRFATRSGVP
jgi:hypothetical protein